MVVRKKKPNNYVTPEECNCVLGIELKPAFFKPTAVTITQAAKTSYVSMILYDGIQIHFFCHRTESKKLLKYKFYPYRQCVIMHSLFAQYQYILVS